MEITSRKIYGLIIGLLAISIFLRIDENSNLPLSQTIMNTVGMLFFVLLVLLPVFILIGLKQANRI